MAVVRNSAELGENAQLIIKRLLANQNLVKLLLYTDPDPLSKPDVAPEEIEQRVKNRLVRIVPRIGPKEGPESIVVVRFTRSSKNENDEFRDILFNIEVFVPLTQWAIKGTNLRPFAIMGEIEKSLKGKKINGLGKIRGGDFLLNFLTEEMSSYEMTFHLTTYD